MQRREQQLWGKGLERQAGGDGTCFGVFALGVGGCRRAGGEGGHAEFADCLLGACAEGGVAWGDEGGLQGCEEVDGEEVFGVKELADGVDCVRCAGHGVVVLFLPASSAADFAHLGFELAAEEEAS